MKTNGGKNSTFITLGGCSSRAVAEFIYEEVITLVKRGGSRKVIKKRSGRYEGKIGMQ